MQTAPATLAGSPPAARTVTDAPHTPAARPRARRWAAWATPGRLVGAAILLGVLVRAALVLASDFPLNDGALFLEMSRAIRAAHYHLPPTVAYNGVDIPFGYSPFAFYLVAALHDTVGLDLIQALRVVPLLATSACVLAFAAFARDVLPRVAAGVTRTEPALVGAVLAFALLPRSYSWLIMGGGLTRSIGFLFAILAIHQAFLLYTRAGWKHAVLLGLFAALTVLSHLGTAPFAAFSIALMFAAYGRHRVGVLGSAVALAVTLAIAAPWAASVVAHHGWAPFVAARSTGGNVFDGGVVRWTISMRIAMLGMGDTGEPLFPLIGAVALFGAVASARARQLVLPCWMGLIFLLEARAPGTYATVPVALLAGIGIAAVLWPAIFPAGTADSRVGLRATRWESWAVVAALLAYVLAGAVARSPSLSGDGQLLRGLPPDERAAMAWVSRSTPADARFLVLTGPGHVNVWGDRVSEWFPTLARRVSVATLQGREWINDGTFTRREAEYIQLQACAPGNGACLDQWARAAGTSYTHVFVSKERSFVAVAPLMSALRSDPAFVVVYDGPGALVVARRGPT